jgi:hypothetical protein
MHPVHDNAPRGDSFGCVQGAAHFKIAAARENYLELLPRLYLKAARNRLPRACFTTV